MRRFVLLAIPALVLAMSLFHFGLEMLHLDFEAGVAGGAKTPPAWIVAASWLLEALALTALYLLLEGRGEGNRWLTGLSAAWIAWVFRGALLVVTVVTFAALPARPWWRLAFSWWFLYTLCGLILAMLAKPARTATSESALP